MLFDRFTSSASLSGRFMLRSIFATDPFFSIDRFLLSTGFLSLPIDVCPRSVFFYFYFFIFYFLFIYFFFYQWLVLYFIDYRLAQHQTELQTPQKRAWPLLLLVFPPESLTTPYIVQHCKRVSDLYALRAWSLFWYSLYSVFPFRSTLSLSALIHFVGWCCLHSADPDNETASASAVLRTINLREFSSMLCQRIIDGKYKTGQQQEAI